MPWERVWREDKSGWDDGECGHKLIAFDGLKTMKRMGVSSMVNQCADCAGWSVSSFPLSVENILIDGVVVKAWVLKDGSTNHTG